MAIGFKKFIVGGLEATDSVIDYLADPQARGDYYTEGGQAILRWLATPRLQRLFALGGPIVLGRTGMRSRYGLRNADMGVSVWARKRPGSIQESKENQLVK